MASNYYKPCAELSECDRLIEEYFLKGQYEECFKGHLRLAEKDIRWRNVRRDIFTMRGSAWKRTWKSHYITRSAPRGTATGTRNSILQTGFTSPALSLKIISMRRMRGIKKQPCRGKATPWNTAKNHGIAYDD